MRRAFRIAALSLVAAGILSGAAGAKNTGRGQEAPLNVALPEITGLAVVGGELTATSGNWDGVQITYTYQWARCGTTGDACSLIQGATSHLHTATGADGGATFRAIVTATNKWGSSVATSEPKSIAPAKTSVLEPTTTSTSTSTAGTTSVTTTSAPTTSTVAAQTLELMYSLNGSRTNPVPLSGATISGSVFIFTRTDGNTTPPVTFTRDGAFVRTETQAPYDFNGGSVTTASSWGTMAVANGSHTIVATDSAGKVASATFVVANGVATTTPTTPSPAPSSGLVKAAQFHCLWGASTDALRSDTLDQFKAAGITAVRIDMAWAGFQPNHGSEMQASYTALADKCVNLVTARGMTPLVTLWWTPNWAGRSSCAGDRMCPPANPATYGNIARMLAQRWVGQVRHFQVWNEPTTRQGWKGTVGDYVAVMCAGRSGFKAGNPDSLTVGIGTDSLDYGFLREAYVAGARNCMDIISAHPYQGDFTSPPEHCPDTSRWWFCNFPRFHAVMQEFGDGAKPVWLTEFGYSVGPPAFSWQKSVTEAQQADYARGAVVLARTWPNVKLISWYKDRELGAVSAWYDGFGLVRRDGTARPVLGAFGGA